MVTKVKAAMVDSDVATQAELDAVSAVASGKLAGDIVQSVHSQSGALITGTTIIPQDDTIPQQTEGVEVFSLAITPTNASNILEIRVVINAASSVANSMVAALFKDSAADAIAVGAGTYQDVVSALGQTVITHRMTAGGTSATTFKVRIGGATAGTWSFNGAGAARYYGGVLASSITITEIKV